MLLHMRDGCLRQANAAEEIQIEEPLPVDFILLPAWFAAASAEISDQHIKASPVAHDAFQRICDSLAVGEIARNLQDVIFAITARQFFIGNLKACSITPSDAYTATFTQEGDSNGLPDAA